MDTDKPIIACESAATTKTEGLSPLGQAALNYAQRGWAVFPCHGIREGQCTCGNLKCEKPGKHPRTEHGLKDATVDVKEIRACWSHWPDANIGHPTGPHAVIDLDSDDAADDLAALEVKYGELPPTLTGATGRGFHQFYLSNGARIRNSTKKLGAQIDVRGEGGYVILPPSLHASGARYEWVTDDEIAPLPPPYVTLLSKPERAKSGKTPGPDKIPAGQRNAHLTSLAGSMRRRGMSEAAIEAALLQENAQKCEPPLSEGEVRSIASSVSRYEPASDAATSAEFTEPGATSPLQPGEGPKSLSDESAATKLIRIAEDWELFHDAMREGYASVSVNGHHRTMRIGSKMFRQQLSFEYFKAERKAPAQQPLLSAIQTIEGMAIFEGSLKSVHVRVAEMEGTLWLDLANDNWEAVRITKRGWEVVQNPPVFFVRQAGMLHLPTPAKGGSLRDIERFTTLYGNELVLLKGYMLGCLREHGPFPILALIGEQGSGKTTLSRLVKRTIDPSKAATRCLPKDERDLMIAAEGQHVLALDNLSRIDEQMSDALCRLATGGGLSTRALYTDRDETVFDCERAIILNAITDVLSRPDLIDRSIIVTVPALEESRRRPERDFWRDFDKVHPVILGGLCDAACMALGETKGLAIPAVRMADFCLFVSRGEKALGMKSRTFVIAYESNRRDANEVAVDFSPVAQALKQFLDGRVEWSGTATELLQELNPKMTDDIRRSREWPKTPRGLSGALRRVIPNLRPSGIKIRVDFREPGTGRRLIEMECSGKPSQPSQSSQTDLTVTDEPIENNADTSICDGLDGCDGLDAIPESVTVHPEGEGDSTDSTDSETGPNGADDFEAEKNLFNAPDKNLFDTPEPAHQDGTHPRGVKDGRQGKGDSWNI